MILAVDGHYENNHGQIAGVCINDWADSTPSASYLCPVSDVADYVPGQFYQRELPGILKLLDTHQLQPEYIIIDGYVYLDGVAKPGLGKHLYDALNGRVKILGVAKKPFAGISDDHRIFRGNSIRPLYITCIGETLEAAKSHILSMHGKHRIPLILKQLDGLCRQQ